MYRIFSAKAIASETFSQAIRNSKITVIPFPKTDLKEVVFVANTLEALREMPKDVRSVIGHNLDRDQQGIDPKDWKPMLEVGPGIRETRIKLPSDYVPSVVSVK